MSIKNKISHAGPSFIVLVCISLFFIIYHEINQSQNKHVKYVTGSDATYYHEYIAVHIFGMDPYFPREKKKVIKYTMGMAVTYTPGIIAGYIASELKGIDHNYGRNDVYQRTLYYLGFIYAFIGLCFVRLILKKWFDDWLIAITIPLIFFGTNLYYYVNVEPLMSHAASFCFVTGFIFFALKFIENKKYKWVAGAAICLGMIVLIRPTNVVIALVPLVYLISKKGAIKDQIQQLLKKPVMLIALILIPVLIFLPQMIYWHHYTGQWLYDSYGKESFYFENPAILQILFSFRKGWFIYTPIMLLIIPGAMICFKKDRPMFWGVLIFMLVNIYIMSSWWCWWYGGGFSLRPMIDFYGLLAIWIAYFLQFLQQKKKWIFASGITILGMFVYLNLYHVRIARLNILHYDSMTYKALREVYIFESNREKYSNEEWDKILNHPNYAVAFEGKRFW